MASYYNPLSHLVSCGIDVDSRGRIWAATVSKQFDKNDPPFEEGSNKMKIVDVFELEVFSTKGEFLGRFPLSHYVNSIRIFKDRLFILDSNHGMCIYEYKIQENR